ncbi:FAD-dependent monooxygenase [Streptomyces sp. NPDC002643]
MPSVRNVLVVGGGTVGNTLTILLRRSGIEVDLVEKDPEWGAHGSGITLLGNALRVLREAGVWDQVEAAIAPTPAHLDQWKYGGPDLPGVCGMYRPTLQAILRDAVRRSGARVRLGSTVEKLVDTGDRVTATLDDGTVAEYDLVVGADGIHSATRAMIGIPDLPSPTGLAIWRAYARRPEGLEHVVLEHGTGPQYITGYNPISATHLYTFIIEDARDRSALRQLDQVAEFRRLTEGLGGFWPAIRESVTQPGQVDYRSLDHLLVDSPWHRGRTIVIGDAAHACPPTLAQGAAMGLEDALVLAELLTNHDTLDQDLFDAFTARRFDRVRSVVRTSVELCDVVRTPERAVDAATLTTSLYPLLRRPA